MVTTAIMTKAMMYFLYRFQIKKMKVFMGFTNQLKDVFGRLEQRKEKAVELRQGKAKSSSVPWKSTMYC